MSEDEYIIIQVNGQSDIIWEDDPRYMAIKRALFASNDPDVIDWDIRHWRDDWDEMEGFFDGYDAEANPDLNSHQYGVSQGRMTLGYCHGVLRGLGERTTLATSPD